METILATFKSARGARNLLEALAVEFGPMVITSPRGHYTYSRNGEVHLLGYRITPTNRWQVYISTPDHATQDEQGETH